MTKYIFILVAFLTIFSLSSLYAQGETILTKGTSTLVREGDFEFVKKLRPTATGLTATLAGSVEECEEALAALLEEQADAKAKRLKKDVYIIESAILNNISENSLDYYYRLSPTDKSNTKSQITFFLSHGNLNFLDSQTHSDEMAAAKLWIQRLNNRMEIERIQVSLKVEEEALEVGSKKEEDLTKEAEKLAKEHAKIMDDESKLQDDIAKLNEKIEKLNAELTESKGKLLEVEESKKTIDAQVLENEESKAVQTKIVTEKREKVNTLKQKQESLKL